MIGLSRFGGPRGRSQRTRATRGAWQDFSAEFGQAPILDATAGISSRIRWAEERTSTCSRSWLQSIAVENGGAWSDMPRITREASVSFAHSTRARVGPRRTLNMASIRCRQPPSGSGETCSQIDAQGGGLAARKALRFSALHLRRQACDARVWFRHPPPVNTAPRTHQPEKDRTGSPGSSSSCSSLAQPFNTRSISSAFTSNDGRTPTSLRCAATQSSAA